MTLYHVKYQILDGKRELCMTLFGQMNAAEDRQGMREVGLVGRWHAVGSASGHCVCTANTPTALAEWLYKWVPMATVDVRPVVTDQQLRAIVLGPSVPDFVTAESDPELLTRATFLVEFKFLNAAQAYDLFSQMNKQDHEEDAGCNVCLGRWHDVATGSGFLVCTSPSAFDVHWWAYKWLNQCSVTVIPVVSDETFRDVVKKQRGGGDSTNTAPARKWMGIW